MKKILVRADDLGYSEAFNYGLARAVKSGIVRSVGVMPNMEWAEHGVNLIKDTDVTFTVHANICQGRPSKALTDLQFQVSFKIQNILSCLIRFSPLRPKYSKSPM